MMSLFFGEKRLTPPSPSLQKRGLGGVSLDKRKSGQTMLEFTFSLVVVLLMIYGLVKVFEWTGKDLVGRRMAEDASLMGPVKRIYDDPAEGPLNQVYPYFYTPTKMNAIWNGT